LSYLRASVAGIAGLWVARFASAETLRAYQTARVHALLRHAYRTVPFYRRRFDDAGFHPDQFRTLDDLQRVPVTPKSDLRIASEEDALASDCHPGSLVRYGTGGSTGAPTEVRFTRFEDRLLRVMRLQVMQALGLRWTDRRCSVVASRSTVRLGFLERHGIVRNRLIHALQPPAKILAELRSARPDVLRGYSSVLSSLTDALTPEDKLRIRPRFITTDSEPLTSLSRERIEHNFGSPVLDVYDCFECNVIAYQCPRGDQYHVLDTSVIAEVLADGRPAVPGECGEIAITSLHAYAAPLIRYMPGDLVQQGAKACTCGAPNSCLAQIYGRSHDAFHLPGGRTLQPKLLAIWIYPLCPYLAKYQLVQESTDRVVLKLQPSSGTEIPTQALEAMRLGMARDLGASVDFRVQLMDDIPSEPNGKFRPYRSDVPE
jgi:phenylacetate-CoA ligase